VTKEIQNNKRRQNGAVYRVMKDPSSCAAEEPDKFNPMNCRLDVKR
jgi:hypothetical protein